ncbi:MAG: S1 RNA-binding domain-containing protein [Nitrosopumilus sp.]|nr:S1 RNA-binding domain-containing protein [Nitrosopumilus sp.]
MSTEIQEMPEQGEIILATVTKVMDHGAYVTLDEYDDIQGFLHISEIAPGWIRSVSRFVKDGEKKVLLVKKVKSNDIDLSLKQVSKDQKKQKLKEVKKYEKGKTLLENLQEKTKSTDEEIEKIEDKMYTQFDSVYDGFMEIARNGISIIADLKLTKKITTALEEICSKIKLPSVEIRGIMEITNNKSNGVEIIK